MKKILVTGFAFLMFLTGCSTLNKDTGITDNKNAIEIAQKIGEATSFEMHLMGKYNDEVVQDDIVQYDGEIFYMDSKQLGQLVVKGEDVYAYSLTGEFVDLTQAEDYVPVTAEIMGKDYLDGVRVMIQNMMVDQPDSKVEELDGKTYLVFENVVSDAVGVGLDADKLYLRNAKDGFEMIAFKSEGENKQQMSYLVKTNIDLNIKYPEKQAQ